MSKVRLNNSLKKTLLFEAGARRSTLKKVFLKSSQKLLEKSCVRAFFDKVAYCWLVTLLKKRLEHRSFPVNFGKSLRSSFLQNSSERLLLRIINFAWYTDSHQCHKLVNFSYCRRALTFNKVIIKFLKVARFMNIMSLIKFKEIYYMLWNWNTKFFLPFFFKSSLPQVLYKRASPKNLSNFTGKIFVRVSFYQVAVLELATLSKKRSWTGVFLWILWNFSEFLFA